MTIYQLHEYSGEYEDFRDRIIGSYLKKERAETEKQKAELKEKELIEHSQKCNKCPFIGLPFVDLKTLLKKYPDYCDKAAFENTDYDHVIDCNNYYSHWDESTFKITEINVEE